MNEQITAPTQVSLPVFTVNSRWEITFFSQAAEDLLGVKAAEAIGMNCHDFFSQHDHLRNFFTLCATISSGKSMTSFPMALKNPATGHNPAVIVTAIPVPDEAGNLAGAIVSFQETPQSFMVNQLVLDSLADGVFTVDINWQITSFNRTAEAITGWSHQEVIGRSCREIFHSNVCGESCLLAKSVRDGKTILDRSIFIERKDGTTVPVSISAAPLTDHEGKVIGGVESFRDITATITKKLILDSIADGVFTVDRNWKISSFNKAAELITGWTEKEVIGKSCSQIFHSNVCGEACILGQSVKQRKTIIDQTIYIKSKKGETIPLSISAAPFLDHQGKIVGGIETFRDMTSSIKKPSYP